MGPGRSNVKPEPGAIIAAMKTPRHCGLCHGSRWLAAAVTAWLALPGLTADAAPYGDGTTRAELASWLDSLRARGTIDVSRPLPWRYVFSSTESRRLEALSVELVGAGYWIIMLAADGNGTRLALVRTELHSPASLERRNRDLAAVAQRHGVAYVGVDVVPAP
jgi:hypothetical protein